MGYRGNLTIAQIIRQSQSANEYTKAGTEDPVPPSQIDSAPIPSINPAYEPLNIYETGSR